MTNIVKAEEPLEKTSIVMTDRGGLAPTDFGSMLQMATIMAKSGLMPSDMQTPERVFVALQYGAEIGLKPMAAVQHICVINGRPSLWGKVALGLIRASGQLEFIEEKELTNEKGELLGYSCTMKRRGQETVTHRFLMSDAKQADLATKKGPWQQYPSRMCQMRARSRVISDLFGDILGGLYIAEEAQDIAPIDVTPEVTIADEMRRKLVAAVSKVEPKVVAQDEDDVPEEVVYVTRPDVNKARPSHYHKTIIKLMERYAACFPGTASEEIGNKWDRLVIGVLIQFGLHSIDLVPPDQQIEFADHIAATVRECEETIEPTVDPETGEVIDG